MKGNLTSRAFHGIKWSYASTAITSVLQIFLSAIMARLLTPEAFGLVAMAMVVISFGGYFAKMGIGPALVQKIDLSTADIHAAFLLSLGLGSLFALLMIAGAPLATLLFDQSDVVPVVRALGLSFLITGLSSTSLHLLQRQLDFRTLGLISIASYALAYGVVGIGLAYAGFGVWSLVVATLTQGGIAALLSIAKVRHGVSLVTTPVQYRDLLSFGGRFSMIGLLDFTGSSLDKLLIGRYLGAGLLGLYDRAYLVAFLPARKLSASFSNVLFPSFSRIQRDVAQLRRGYVTTILLFGVLILPACVGLSVTAREAVLLLLGDQWLDAIPVLQVLALAVALQVLTGFSTVTCEATARLNARIVLQIGFILALGFFFYLFRERGLVGFAWALLCAQAARHLSYGWVMHRALQIPMAHLLRAYVPGLVYSTLIGGLLMALSELLYAAQVPGPWAFGLEIIAGGVILALCIGLMPIGEVRTVVERVLPKLNLAPATRLHQVLVRLPAVPPLLVLLPAGAVPLALLTPRMLGALGINASDAVIAWQHLSGGLAGAGLVAAGAGLVAGVSLLYIGYVQPAPGAPSAPPSSNGTRPASTVPAPSPSALTSTPPHTDRPPAVAPSLNGTPNASAAGDD